MKKVSAIAIAAIMILGLTSCRKDYVCTCTVLSIPIPSSILDSKKNDAEDVCDQLESVYRLGDPTASCKLN